MPNYFSLTKKGETKITPLSQVDEELRNHFHAPADPESFYTGWMDTIGLGIACGKGLGDPWWDEHFKELGPKTQEVYNYLKEHYTSDAWYMAS